MVKSRTLPRGIDVQPELINKSDTKENKSSWFCDDCSNENTCVNSNEEVVTFAPTQRVVIPFNKPPFFKDDLNAAIADAHAYGKFSGDGLLTKRCTDFFKSQ